jgi:parallel beta-helix repeat protein
MKKTLTVLLVGMVVVGLCAGTVWGQTTQTSGKKARVDAANPGAIGNIHEGKTIPAQVNITVANSLRKEGVVLTSSAVNHGGFGGPPYALVDPNAVNSYKAQAALIAAGGYISDEQYLTMEATLVSSDGGTTYMTDRGGCIYTQTVITGLQAGDIVEVDNNYFYNDGSGYYSYWDQDPYWVLINPYTHNSTQTINNWLIYFESDGAGGYTMVIGSGEYNLASWDDDLTTTIGDQFRLTRDVKVWQRATLQNPLTSSRGYTYSSTGITGGTQILSSALTTPDYTYIGATNVWVDASWTANHNGDVVGGHVYGQEAFDNIQQGINGVSGSTVNVAAGTYTDDIWNSSLGVPAGYRITKSITLLGAKAGIDPAGSTDRGGESILVRTNGTPYSLYASNITIDGFTFMSGGGSGGGRIIVSDNGDGAIVRNCIIKDIAGTDPHGIYIYPGAENVKIERNTFSNTAWEAISCDGKAKIFNNTIKEIPSNKGIQVGASGNAEINGNIINNTFYEGILAYGLSTITNNNMSQCYKGIQINGSAGGSTISGNTISNTTYEGIQAWVPSTINGNHISNCYKGIQTNDGAGGSTISNNTISNTTYEGIQAYVPVTIDGNDISVCYKGIQITGSAGASTISGNTISKTTYEGIQAWVPSTITGNDISGYWSGIQIRNHSTGTVVDLNNIHNNTYHGLDIPNVGGSEPDVTEATIVNNTFANNGWTGIRVGGGTDGSGIAVHFNCFFGNGIYGVESVTTGSDVSAENNWWGSPNGPCPPPGLVCTGFGDKVSSNVAFDPWTGKGWSTLKIKYVVHAVMDPSPKPKVVDVPVSCAEVRVYTRKDVCTNGIFVTGKPKMWGQIYDGLDGPGGSDPGCPVVSAGCYVAKGLTDENGEAAIFVPPTTKDPNTDYVVIGRSPIENPVCGCSTDPTIFDDLKTLDDPDGLYSGETVNNIKAGETKNVKLHKIRLFNGKNVPGKALVLSGTYLGIIEPEYMDWTIDQEKYPIVLESEGDWDVTTNVQPPEGFVSDYQKLASQVSDTTAAIQFTLTDVGSKWTTTKLTHAIKHKGKKTTLDSDIPMFDKKKKDKKDKDKDKKGPKSAASVTAAGDEVGVALIPTGYALYQNYPDPFNPSTTLQFDLPEPAIVTMRIYNTLGQEVANLLDRVAYEPGKHAITFDASRLSSGVYIYQLIAGRFVDSKKMLLLK